MSSTPWTELADDALLEWRICDLRLSLADSSLEPLITQLHQEIATQGIVARPPCYLGDEWFCEEGVPAISIPFYLAHSRLSRLEEKLMLNVEGGTREECLKLLRHEMGHALMYAYRLNRTRRFRAIFGSSAEPYEENYHPRPYSKSYVIHLDNWYAQSHPDEDFAETFAVWLTPDQDWRARYVGWKALEKLMALDQMMREIAGTAPRVTATHFAHEASRLTRRLKTHYQRKRKTYAADFPDFYDNDLRRLFPAAAEGVARGSAAIFLRTHRRPILAAVNRWTKTRKYHIATILRQLMERCRTLDLRVARPEHELIMDVSIYLTALMMTYLHTGKFKR
ncbi:MAG: putative zinc-binding metallopeptidase [Deltaproteobacteria bacterium]|nr:putative zinc-binding metallopeptidase [Deltaproteobacteria bacterium]